MQPSNFIVPGRLKYITGDATIPESAGMRFIIHVCNASGGWGKGFVLAISKKWKNPEQEYRRWFATQNNFRLGEIQAVQVQSDTSIINMIAQKAFDAYAKEINAWDFAALAAKEKGEEFTQEIPLPVDFTALEQCLDKVGELVQKEGGSIHAPRFGAGLAAGLAGGKGEWSQEVWNKVEALIISKLIRRGINVTIYDLPEDQQKQKVIIFHQNAGNKKDN